NLWRRRHGWPVDGVVLQPPAGAGGGLARGDHRGGRQTGAAGDDDGPDSDFRPAAGGAIDTDRGADATAPGDRRGRRDADNLAPATLPDAAPVQLLRPPRAPRRCRRPRPLTAFGEASLSVH